MLLKYFTFTVIIAVCSYFCLNGTDFVFYFDLLYSKLSIFTVLSSFIKNDEPDQISRLFTIDELKQYDGESGGEEIYLAILGNVFDVSKGSQHYAPGGSYHGFAGRDATRAFVSGEFTEEGLVDEISDFDYEQLLGVQDWVKMYESKYEFKGKLIGRFYDRSGQPSPYLKEIEAKISVAEERKEEDKKDKEKFPPCNSEWTSENGSRVWCSKRSGGIKRSWVGVPRIYHHPGAKSYRCACINEEELGRLMEKSYFKEYPNCHPKSETCFIHED